VADIPLLCADKNANEASSRDCNFLMATGYNLGLHMEMKKLAERESFWGKIFGKTFLGFFLIL